MSIPFIQEFIADLEYDENGNCIITRTHEAVDVSSMGARLARTLRSGSVPSKGSGKGVDLKFTAAPLSICVHSDTPGSTDIAAKIRSVVDEFNRETFS